MDDFSTNESRWTALQSHNPAAANAFVYSVVTTKIYCRPTCPSRLARRANIVFHDCAKDAEADGFRACKRCRPDVNQTELDDPQKKAVRRACDLIEKEMPGGEKWGVKALAREVGLTESHFCRVFKKISGLTIGGYRAQSLTKKSAASVSEEAGATSTAVVPDAGAANSETTSELTEIETWNLPLGCGLFDLEQNWNLSSEDWNSADLLELFPGMDPTALEFIGVDKSSSMPISDQSIPGSVSEGLHLQDLDFQLLMDYHAWQICCASSVTN